MKRKREEKETAIAAGTAAAVMADRGGVRCVPELGFASAGRVRCLAAAIQAGRDETPSSTKGSSGVMLYSALSVWRNRWLSLIRIFAGKGFLTLSMLILGFVSIDIPLDVCV
ncbi:hypothetical protein EUGRSUZ_E01964 [Eucalyptus grandis]|uniref:Uncharacterized protein n=2 Tax=Eucalyptus grandis TaxID=71139 RepID=A0ACC3KWR8_EUCGR|nr:hypothetical protein EUGRSUZ_E01964 [Eucalyptus grandis]